MDDEPQFFATLTEDGHFIATNMDSEDLIEVREIIQSIIDQRIEPRLSDETPTRFH